MTETPKKISFSPFRFYTLETATSSKITTKKNGPDSVRTFRKMLSGVGIVCMDTDTSGPHPNVDNTKFENADTDADTFISHNFVTVVINTVIRF